MTTNETSDVFREPRIGRDSPLPLTPSSTRPPSTKVLLSQAELACFGMTHDRDEEVVFIKCAALGRLLRAKCRDEAMLLGWWPSFGDVLLVKALIPVILGRAITAKNEGDTYLLLDLVEKCFSAEHALRDAKTLQQDGEVGLQVAELLTSTTKVILAHACSRGEKEPQSSAEQFTWERIITTAYMKSDRDPRDCPDDPIWHEDSALRGLSCVDPSLRRFARSGVSDTSAMMPSVSRSERAVLLPMVSTKPEPRARRSHNTAWAVGLAAALLSVVIGFQLTRSEDPEGESRAHTDASLAAAQPSGALGPASQPTVPDGGHEGVDDPRTTNQYESILRGSIIDHRLLLEGTTHYLEGHVYVEEGASLTIHPGVRIVAGRGSRLVISRGAKIHARGRSEAPIVFDCARHPEPGERCGPWGGIILLGRDGNGVASEERLEFCLDEDDLCSSHRYGGTEKEDTSGELEYVVIGHPGESIAPRLDLNGLTLGAVGPNTLIDNIAIIGSRDDCVEAYGGSANLRHVACFDPGDDGIDMDEGYDGTIQYFLHVSTKALDDDDGNDDALRQRALEDRVFAGIEFRQQSLYSRKVTHLPIVANSTFCADSRSRYGNPPEEFEAQAGYLDNGSWIGYGNALVGFHSIGHGDFIESKESLCATSALDYKPRVKIAIPCPDLALTAREIEGDGSGCFVGAFEDAGDRWDVWMREALAELSPAKIEPR